MGLPDTPNEVLKEIKNSLQNLDDEIEQIT